MRTRLLWVPCSCYALAVSLTACAPSAPELRLTIRQSGNRLAITNNEDAAVAECLVQLNGAAFETKNVTLPASTVVQLPLRGFTKGDGTRFNPETHAVQDILVQCFRPTTRVATFGL